MVEVFKTDVTADSSARILEELSLKYPEHEINFDLEDCDRILRISGPSVSIACVVALLQQFGCFCEVLPD